MTVNNLNGLSTHSIRPITLPNAESSFLGADGAGDAATGGATVTLTCVLAVARLTGATFAGALMAFGAVFLAVTIPSLTFTLKALAMNR